MRIILLAACLGGIIILSTGCSEEEPLEPVKEEITYNYIMAKYFPEDKYHKNYGYDIELGGFYDEFDRRCGERIGRLSFGKWDGNNRQMMRFSEDSVEGIKAFCITRDLHQSQVFVFRDIGGCFVFAYEFITEGQAFADRSKLSLFEMEEDVTILRLTYRNGSGTGVQSGGISLYLLEESKGILVFQTDLDGYMSGWPSADYNYECNIKSIKETWPRLELEYNSEWLLTERLKDDRKSYIGVGMYELKADIVMEWSGEEKRFVKSAENVLSSDVIEEIIDDQIGFLFRHKDDEEYLAQDNCPITFDKDATAGKIIIK